MNTSIFFCGIDEALSFAPEHEPYYVLSTRKLAERGQLQFADERNELFLEFVKAERLDGETMPEGFWFADLLKLGVLGSKACDGNEQEIAEKQVWLCQWGYTEKDLLRIEPRPFPLKYLDCWHGLMGARDVRDDSGHATAMGRFLAERMCVFWAETKGFCGTQTMIRESR